MARLIDPLVNAAKDDPLIVLEAMKMEHVLAAPRDGVLAAVNVAEGDQVVDGTVLLLTAGLLNLALLAWLDPPPLLREASGLDALLRLLELEVPAVLRRISPTLVMGALYFGLFWSLTGQTLGHRVLKLRVVDPYGQPPRPLWAALRVLGHGLGLAVGAMGWLWVAFDREKRGLHDHLARTYVVRES